MPTGSGILRLARGRSSAIDLDTEEGRAFLQERLAVYNKVCFLISGSFFLISALLMASGLEAPDAVTLEHVERAVWLQPPPPWWCSCWCGSAARRAPGSTPAGCARWSVGALVLVCVGLGLQLDAAGRCRTSSPWARSRA